MSDKKLATIAWTILFCAVALFFWSIGIKVALIVLGIAAGILAVIWSIGYLSIYYDSAE